MRRWPPSISLVDVVGVGDDDQQAGGAGAGEAELAVEGVDRAAEPLGAVVARKSVTRAGTRRAGSGRGPLAVQDGGGDGGGQVAAARARIQAAEATGAANAHGAGDVAGDADPQGGAGTRRLRVRVKGSAVGTAPAARCAWDASALPMRAGRAGPSR